jgi:hypothetical protein
MADDQRTHTPLAPQLNPQQSITGNAGKEGEPIGVGRAASVEVPKPVEKPKSDDVSAYIEEQDKKVHIPQALRAIGVSRGRDESVDLEAEGPQLPLTDEEIAAGLKQPLNTTGRWLSALMLYILQQSHYTIRTVKGHVQRVFKP